MTSQKTRRIPPRLARWLLKRMADYQKDYSITGDIDEVFYQIAEDYSYLYAWCWYWYQCINSTHNYVSNKLYWRMEMFRNYLKIALRNVKKQKTYSILNIFGLATGMVCFLLIMLYIRYELSYDEFHKKADIIYRISQDPEKEEAFVWTPYPLGPVLQSDYPAVVDYSRLQGLPNFEVQYNDIKHFEPRIFLADPNFFTVFSYKLKKGDPQTALSDINSVVITEEMALKYFGLEDPIGKTITMNQNIEFTVTGIAEEVPNNTHFHFNFLGSMARTHSINNTDFSNNWLSSSFHTYLLFENEMQTQDFPAKVVVNSGKYPARDLDFFESLFLTPLKQIHFRNIRGNLEPSFNMIYIYLFSIIAVIILIVSCINFTNLAIAQTVKRAKEVGLRKIVGAMRTQLIYQYLCESTVIAFLALLTAIVCTYIFMPLFNSFLDVELSFDLTDINFYGILLLLTLCVGVISGGYPALFLSAFRPVNVLKGAVGKHSRGTKILNGLVIIQITISVILIIGTFVIQDQIHFVKNKDLGWNKEQIVYIPLNDNDLRMNPEPLKAELLKSPDIISGTTSNFRPSQVLPRRGNVWWEGRQKDERMAAWAFIVDYDFFKTFEIDIIEGRDFSRDITTDLNGAFILNEAAVKVIGIEDPVGKQFNAFFGTGDGSIIGIVKDFNFRSLHHTIEPALFFCTNNLQFLSLRVNTDNISGTMNYMENIWQEIRPGKDFEYFFLDEEFNRIYQAETKLVQTIQYFAIVSIFIACLGLFGLSALFTEQKTKEIGIRRVLGSSVSGIIINISRRFLRWLIVANVIAWPVAYYLVNEWLQNFAYHVSPGWIPFITSALFTAIIILIVVCFQILKAAHANPVDSLRYE
ncbi:ABC transporter permease [candidate division KSB1 bacterium]